MIIIIIIEAGMKAGNRKHSRKRDEILNVIRSTASHPSARWVYEQLRPAYPRLSLGTVYRNIRAFQEEGELISVGVVEGEERFDGRVQPHPHFICTRCGEVIDIAGNGNKTLEEQVVPAQPEAGIFAGLYVDHRKTLFYGLCGDCRKAVDTGNGTVKP
ncbi:MAG: transcriptional repressor [Treponema sp.]|jgi:Fur family peroxide stress response transcriptional regulator|nr:transcriptional repressor [Treponema sp.]